MGGPDVRNPSAFVSSIAHKALQTMKGAVHHEPMPHEPTLTENVEAAINVLGLDESAAQMVHQIPPELALDIFGKMRDTVRNPSAFVMASARKAMQGMSKGGGPQGYPYEQL